MVYLSLLSPFLLLCNLFWGFLNANLSKKKGKFRKYPVGIYLFKFDSGNTRTMLEICSKLTIKKVEQ